MKSLLPSRDATSADVVLSDGEIGIIRALGAGDRPAVQALHDNASDEAFRLRFFSAGRANGKTYVAHVFADRDVLCLVACLHGEIVALATAEPIGPASAEVSFLVADDERGLGLGSLLLEHLAARCRDTGIECLIAEVLWENRSMLEVFRNAGFASTRTDEGATVRLEMHTELSVSALSAADHREAQASGRSLAAVLTPRVVALVGVRSDRSGIGYAIQESIRLGDFAGTLVVVHPTETSTDGIAVYPTLTEVPGLVDLAIIAVPAIRVLDAVRDAVRARVRGVVVISSGFSELGEAGHELQRALVRLARGHGVRLIGPNCLGILLNDPAVHLNATFTRSRPPAGGLAMASQSGGVGIVLLDVATELGLGVRTFISLGNKADVSGNDLLSAWIDDPEITAAALYLESFGNAPKFARIARDFARVKPLLAVVGGRSSGGQRAGASHTAAAATPAVAVDALFAQAGVIGCRGAEDMAATALLLTAEPLPRGRRVGIVTNAGGIGVLAADTADEFGLSVPEFSEHLRTKIAGQVLGTSGLGNPVDTGAGASAVDLAGCVDAVLASGEVDAVLVVLVSTALSDPAGIVAALSKVRARYAGTPVLLVNRGAAAADTVPDRQVITTFPGYVTALEALSRAARRTEWLAASDAPETTHDGIRARAARQHALVCLEGAAAPGWLTAAQTARLLDPYGLDQCGVVAVDELHATRAAAEIGYPVVAKVADPAVQHKTDRGLVKAGLQSSDDLRAALASFARELDRTDTPVLIQPTASGVEVALGIVNDPSFGPILRVASGGIGTNLWDDQAFLLAPVSPTDARDALRGLRIWPLLEGYRGSEPCAVEALVDQIVALGQLAADVPEISELDLNPVMVDAEQATVVDAKVRLGRNQRQGAGVPRQLNPVI